MKKVSLIIAALALVLGISQCKKQENPVGGKLITQKVTFTTSFGDGSKVGVDENAGALALSWQVGDKITVSDGQTEPSSILECKSVSADGLTGTFEGTITCIEDAELTFTVGTEPNYMNQHVTEINESEIYLVGESGFIQSGDYEVGMALPYAILKVDLEELATAEAANVSVKINDETDPAAVVTGVKTDACQVYLLLPLTVTGQTTLTFTNDTDTKSIIRKFMLAPNGFYTAGGTGDYAPVLPQGALPGLFSVSDDKQVWFSKGNLQYVKNGTKWQFAANQWETVETQDEIVGDDYDYADIQTLFGWGDLTPLKTSTNDGDYSWSEDWGTKIDDKGTWRTLSKDEWVYLIEDRTVNGGKGEGKSYQRATVNSVYGMILYPDNYTEQASYASTDWATMEEAGCVFLPAAGNRDDISPDQVGSYGCYWSSSYDSSDLAYSLEFSDENVSSESYGYHCGFSVRLVSGN